MKEQHLCSVSGDYVVRVAGLPLTALAVLRFERSLVLIQELLRLEERLSSSGTHLSEQLHAVIGTLTGAEQRRPRQQLIELRRALFQGRQPAPALLAPDLLACLPAELRAAIGHWQAELEQRAALLAEVRRVFVAELDERRAALRDLAGRERFLQGVLLASPSLYLDCSRWLTAAPAEAGRFLDRKLEDGLLNYLTRMAAKTSPYSTFTALAHGHFAPAQEQQDEFTTAGTERRESGEGRSVIELNLLLVDHIARALAQWPAVRHSLRVSVNPSLVSSDSVLRFISRDELGRERLAAVRATPSLRAVLQLVEGRQPLSYGELLEALSALDPQGRRQELAEALDQLCARGLLQLDFAIPEQAQDHLLRLCEALAPIEQRPVQAIRGLLLELHQSLATYERTAQARQRYALLQQLRALLERLFSELGLSERPGFALPAKNLIYEHTLLKTAPGSSLPALESDLLADLALVQRLTSLYDPLLTGRLALASFFRRRYGVGATVDLMTFYADCYRECQQLAPALFSQPAGMRPGPSTAPSAAQALQLFSALLSENGVEQEELARVMALRQEIARVVADQPPDSISGIRALDRQRLHALLERCPASVELPSSLALHCQLYWQDGQRCLVLNSIQSGFGRHLRRLGYLEAQLAPASRESEMQAGGAALADTAGPLPVAIQGIFGSNLNLRLPGSEYEIAYPGSPSSGSPERLLPLSDLLVQHDSVSQRLVLRSRRLNRQLLPMHLGLMSDYWLPPLYRFLLWACGETPGERLWSLRLLLLDPPLTRGSKDAREPQPRYQPRTCLGRICLNRAHWYLPPACLPVRQKGESHFDYFLKVQRWSAQHRLPARCFLRVNPFDFQAAEGPDGSAYSLSKERKPVYLDFESYFSLSMFEHLIEKSSFGLLLEEALPAETDLLPAHEGGYVCEYVFEVNRQGA
ncbi:lantibiotic dehydratase [Thermogemmatispora carboxidivorans]|uniref:lantibiotic dehydratase n=1 Tax=Thermogemmatispora carboxidivorans TaxID=1382306 RepID=UPI00069C4B76|nr:lantibiotic dehydratase [Thermogemmatispora carboxidivorans]